MTSWTVAIVLCSFEFRTYLPRHVFVSASDRGLHIQPVEMMLNEQMHCALFHLSISAFVCPQIDKHGDICHHQDKVECALTGISNLHNKQWNSNYQPAQTIFPAVTFGPWYCSIIHRHSRLAEKKKKEKKLKERRGRQPWAWCINAGIKPVLQQIWIKQSSIHARTCFIFSVKIKQWWPCIQFPVRSQRYGDMLESLAVNCSRSVYKYTFQIRGCSCAGA